MEVNRSIFREYDIRGIVEKDLKGEFPYFLGKSIGTMIKRKGENKVVVGGDNRLSTPTIKEKLINGIIDTGCDVIDIGIVPTPIVYFSIHFYSISSGVMVTASHNPPEFNGFKIVIGKISLYGKEIQKLADFIEKEDFEKGKGKKTEKNATEQYLKYLKEKFIFKRKLKIGIDTGNGTVGPIIVPLLKNFGMEVFPLYQESDGSFPNHLPDPVVVENLADLIALVKEQKLDAGLGIDGDGDRLGVVDENGKILWGDQLLIIYAKEILEKNPKSKIIFDVKCSKALEEEIKKHGGEPLMWKTGHSLIENKLHQEKALLAGELSGHIYFADDYFGYDDAIYASLRLLKIISEKGEKLSKLLEGVKEYYSTPEIRINVDDDKKFKIVKNLQDYFRDKFPTSEIDGVKVYFPDGWALVRASNTQPALVLRVEGKNKNSLEKIKNDFLEIVEKMANSK